MEQVLWLFPQCTVPSLAGLRSLLWFRPVAQGWIRFLRKLNLWESCENVWNSAFLSLQDSAAWGRAEMGMTQVLTLETLWESIIMEMLMTEPSDRKETELDLTLNPLHEIVELTGSQLCFLLTTIFRRLLNNSSENIGKNGAFWASKSLAEHEGALFHHQRFEPRQCSFCPA